jgi:hypothetical protein
MEKDLANLLLGLMEVARTDHERAKVDVLRERCRKDGPSAVKGFMLEEPIIALRLFDLAYGKEAVDLSLLKAAEEMGVDLDEMKKKFKSHQRALRLKKSRRR